ncbi:hypothetical protein [Mycobacterium sp. Aquia_213]|uniref:hypothetical protein n=1 Tax=Mycobacterium sp. Aquia_213 TaxID=2991728 RepID=UPI00226D9E0C|nr:hypothetical protein [Mycobacterium sp. Aquia_213]WAC90770.1 hypothetical protein LMQ14_23180 [Mycobacterium sp. Aquia_213]
MICVLVWVVAGCGKTTDGNAVRASTTASSTPTSTTTRRYDPAEPVPGVEATPPDHIPPNALACLPAATGNGRMAAASVSDPVAPRLTVPLPDGWNSAPGAGDLALTATGPDGLSAKVTITPTDLEAGGAFLRYGADLHTANPGVQVSVEAAQFCGYSSQLLSGNIGAAGGVAFADRITHIWTNTKAFLVVVHLEGPASAPGFSAAKSTVMQQFAVVIP